MKVVAEMNPKPMSLVGSTVLFGDMVIFSPGSGSPIKDPNQEFQDLRLSQMNWDEDLLE